MTSALATLRVAEGTAGLSATDTPGALDSGGCVMSAACLLALDQALKFHPAKTQIKVGLA